jgi:capsid protein
MWRSFMQDRDYFTQHFLTPIYAAWMEEAISLGLIEVPESIGGPLGFYRNKTALTMCEWLGPSRGSVDPLKEANANNLDIAAGRASTVAQILESNRSPVDLLDEEAAYQEMRKERGLGVQQLDIKTDSAGSEDGGGEGEGGTADDRDGDGKANEEEQDQAGDRRRRQNA